VTSTLGHSETPLRRDLQPSVLFVTDEVFLPQRNGSHRIYLDVAGEYRAAGWRIACLSFARRWTVDNASAVTDAYRAVFDSHFIAPGPSGSGSAADLLGYALREVELWMGGDIFSQNRLLALNGNYRLASRWLNSASFSTLYFHKPQSALYARALTGHLRAHRILDMHDDFVERFLQSKEVCSRHFAHIGWRKAVSTYGREGLRYSLSRLDVARSREAELKIMKDMDEVRVASETESRSYRNLTGGQVRVRHVPWRLATAGLGRRLPSLIDFDCGFIGSGDVMNVDAVHALIEEVIPRLARHRVTPKILICGGVARRAADLFRAVPCITYRSRVDDVAEFYDAVRIVVAPMRYGTGVSIKAGEALEHGRRVVATEVGARGLPAQAGLYVARTWDDFAEVLVHWLRLSGQAGGAPRQGSASP
jgi:glycosyltransferase involved in cell wall biosynthesis